MSHDNSPSNQQTIPPCAAGLTPDDLSAWRDETLDAAVADRIAAHSAGCPACQQRLRGFETVATALTAQRVPVPDERLWQEVRAAILASEPVASDDDILYVTTLPDQSDAVTPIPPPSARARTRRRRALGTLAAVAAIALVVVGFGRLFQFGGDNRPAETFQLHWRQVTLPGAMGASLGVGATLSVFPADGSIAWICQAGTSDTPGDLRLWRTRDAGASWQSIQTPPIPQAYNCTLALDQLDPDVVILTVTSKVTEHQTPQTYSTFNGGAHWENDPLILPMPEFATLNGTTYAIRQDATDANRLEIGLKTSNQNVWLPVDDVLLAHSGGAQPTRFWLNPETGGLLVQAISSQSDGTTSFSFWTADLANNIWQRVGESPVGVTAAFPTSADRWSICTLAEYIHRDPFYRDRVYCGTDTTNWNTRPGLDVLSADPAAPTPCGGCGAITLVGMANDGAVLVTADDRFGAKGATIHTGLYRLPAGSSQWQNGGGLPGAVSNQVVNYTPRPNGGIFWSMPIQGDDGHGDGAVFTAIYPGTAAQPQPTRFTKTLPTPTPTGAIDQGAPLEWQPINQPDGFQPKFIGDNILAVAPGDGQTAYACAQPNNGGAATQLLGWVTHNAGATWASLALPKLSGWCSLVVDETNPRDVLLGFSHNPPAGGPIMPEQYYRSADGGASWRDIPGLDGSVIYQFASYRGAVYALRYASPGSVSDFAHVQVSTDGMSSWRTIDGGFFSSGTTPAQLWLNPYNGVLLVANIPAPLDGIPLSNAVTALIWRSSDGGAHWRDLGTPQLPHDGTSSVFVQSPQPNHTWRICVANTAPSGSALVCGDDSGQAWQTLPLLDPSHGIGQARYTAYTSDGAVLAVIPTNTQNGATSYTVYRLPSGAKRWQSLGPAPEFSLLYAPASGGDGMLWSVPVNGIITDASGRIFRVAAP